MSPLWEVADGANGSALASVPEVRQADANDASRETDASRNTDRTVREDIIVLGYAGRRASVSPRLW
jgi:hypothetical protein